ncbi:MAG: ABC transporter permease [Gemmatimonadota bacterium]|nr:MAG: ABC transporter permease [Gemmatimonadota bacterium]
MRHVWPDQQAKQMTWFHRIVGWLLPRRFRYRHGRDLVELYEDMYPTSGRLGRVRFGVRVVGETLITCILARLDRVRGWSRGGNHNATERSGAAKHSSVLGGGTAILSLWQDVHFGFRTLRKRPLFTAVAVVTLGLGIGGATAIFSVVEGMFFPPLPYERPRELVTVLESFPQWRTNTLLASEWDRVCLDFPDYERWRAGQSFFQDVAAFGSTSMTLSGLGEPELIQIGTASSSLLHVLGVRPSLGRGFMPDESGRNAVRVAIISHTFWQERLGEDPDVLGKAITLDGQAFQIVGVLPRSFRIRRLGCGADPADPGTPPVWIPVGIVANSLRTDYHLYDGIGRLKAGVTLDQALTQTESLIRGDRDSSQRGASLMSEDDRREFAIGPYRTPLLLLMGASLILLVLACGNVATLLLAEIAVRHREMMTRAALGAKPFRLVRQLLTESVLLGIVGSAAAILLAVAGTRALTDVAPPFPWLQQVRVNGMVLIFASAAGVLSGLVFGLAPSIGLRRLGTAISTIRAEHKWQRRLQSSVVSMEIALTVMLLVSGGLLARSLVGLFSVDPGFRHENLAEVRVLLSQYRFVDPDARSSVFQEIRDAIAAVPGVLRVSGTSGLPFSGSGWLSTVRIEGKETLGEPWVHGREVLPGFFDVMELPMVSGRTFVDADHWVEPRANVIVSETMAQRFWPGEDPVGARVRYSGQWLTVTGVVGDVRHERLDSEFQPTMYIPVSTATASLVVRTAVEPQHLFPQLRQAVSSVDPGAPILRLTPVSSLMTETTAHERFRTVILLTFASIAVVLGAAGVFGVTARSVARRTKEIGIRMALGAKSAEVTRNLLGRSIRACILGIAFGLVGAFTASKLLSPFLFEVSHWDPPTYSAVVLLTVGVCWLASYVPARRIAGVNPVDVLRAE